MVHNPGVTGKGPYPIDNNIFTMFQGSYLFLNPSFLGIQPFVFGGEKNVSYKVDIFVVRCGSKNVWQFVLPKMFPVVLNLQKD